MPRDTLLSEIDVLVEKGYREIVLTGIHLGSYGEEFSPPVSITGLLRSIEERRYPCRFRVSSLDSDEITDELIELMATSETICRHLHLPVQSGDDTIIRRMGRGGGADAVRERVERITSSIPDVAIGVDIIVGFPGEGEGEFMNTVRLLDELPVAYMHIFPFSKREGTPAASFTGQVGCTGNKGAVQETQGVGRGEEGGLLRRTLGQGALRPRRGGAEQDDGPFAGEVGQLHPRSPG